MVAVENLVSSRCYADTFSYSCKCCILAHLANCEERKEEKRCPICSHGPINVRFLDIILILLMAKFATIGKPTTRGGSRQQEQRGVAQFTKLTAQSYFTAE